MDPASALGMIWAVGMIHEVVEDIHVLTGTFQCQPWQRVTLPVTARHQLRPLKGSDLRPVRPTRKLASGFILVNGRFRFPLVTLPLTCPHHSRLEVDTTLLITWP